MDQLIELTIDLMLEAKWRGMTVEERFFKYVMFTDSCWIWIGRSRHQDGGYGDVGFRKNKHFMAHRLAWLLLKGPISLGLTIDHLCRVKCCVNPSHMELVTAEENVRRAFAAKTHCKRGHPLNGPNLKIDVDGSRQCRICRRERQRASRGGYVFA